MCIAVAAAAAAAPTAHTHLIESFLLIDWYLVYHKLTQVCSSVRARECAYAKYWLRYTLFGNIIVNRDERRQQQKEFYFIWIVSVDGRQMIVAVCNCSRWRSRYFIRVH